MVVVFLTKGRNSEVVVNSGLTLCVINKIFFSDFQNIIDVSKKENFQKGNVDDDFRSSQVFSQVPKSLILDLYTKIYKIDFDMFAFPYPEKFIRMGK
jgi:hypothetical protein